MLLILILAIAWLGVYPRSLLAARQRHQRWRQIHVDQFTIIYPEHARPAANELIDLAETHFQRVAALCGYQPEGPIPIVLNADTDIANAFAQSVFKKIEIFLAPPLPTAFTASGITWWQSLILHEYAHLCHGMNDDQGISWWISSLFGQIQGLNFVAPRWWIEGVGVYSETVVADKGRGESSYFQMQLAANLLSNQPWSRAQAAHAATFSRPWGRIYFWGYALIKQATLEHAQVIATVSQAQSRWPVWGFGAVWQEALDQSLSQLWQETLKRKKKQYQQRYSGNNQPMKNSRYLTDDQGVMIQSPVWIDNETVVAHSDDLNEGKAIKAYNLTTGQQTIWQHDVTLQGQMAWQADRKQLLYATLDVDPFEGNHFRAQLWGADKQKKIRLLTSHRCWSPTTTSNGNLAVIENNQGKARLRIYDQQAAGWSSWQAPASITFQSPRFSPTGNKIAAVARHQGSQDIAIVDLSRQSIHLLATDQQLVELDPIWSPDGNWLYFISDQSGSFQLVAWSLASHQWFQVSRAQLGVFQPALSPNGQQVALVEYQIGNQQQLLIAPLVPEHWEKIGVLEPVLVKEEIVPDQPIRQVTDQAYQAWPYLLPTFWLPVFDQDQNGLLAGIMTLQRDPLEIHEWQGQVLFSPHQSYPYGSFRYTNRYWPLSWSLLMGREATDQFIIQNPEQQNDWSIRHTLKLASNLVWWHHRSRDRYHYSAGNAAVGWNRYHANHITTAQSLNLEAIFSHAQGVRRVKDLFTVKGWEVEISGKSSLQHAWSTGVIMTLAGHGYWPGLFDHHGWQLGWRGCQQSGLFLENNTTCLPRGYQSALNSRDYQSTASLSYRLPLWYIDQGWAEWPVFFRDLWMALIYESGWSWNKNWTLSEIRQQQVQSVTWASVLDGTLFWYVTAALRSHLVYRINHQDWQFGIDLQVNF